MIRNLLIGAALGYVGKKLFDEGKLDPYIAQVKDKLAELNGARSPVPPSVAKEGKGQPDLAF